MSTNGFLDSELITKRINGQVRTFPVVGGRLRLAHEHNTALSIQTEIVRLDPDFAVVKAVTTTEKGVYNGTGTASATRDARLADSLLELAETRAIARSLRWASYGLEMTGAEEMSHVPDGEGAEPKKEPIVNHNGNGNKASQSQCRALYALTRKAQYHEEDIANLLAPFGVSRFEDLPRESASQLISCLQTEVAA
jgi:hypothetical protein